MREHERKFIEKFTALELQRLQDYLRRIVI
jgi:hypothetical protein